MPSCCCPYDSVIPNAVRDGRFRLRLVPQSRLEPMDLEVRLDAPGWSVDGSDTRRGKWDRVWLLDWGLDR